MIQQKIYFTDSTYKRMYEDGYLGNANIVFENALDKEDIFNIGKQSHFYIVDEDLKQRIDKALEYIEHYLEEDRINCENIYHSVYDELLDILKGIEKD